jgi:N-acetyl-alpha-D-glucosaminyl L-malate synthase BshA
MTEPSLRIGIACYPSVGGSGILATALGVDLARRGHEVHFISYERPFRLPPDEPRVTFHPVHIQGYGLFKHPDYTLPLAVKMTEVVRERRLHILHAHYAVPHATAAVLARDWLPEELRPGVVATLHGTDTTLLGRDPGYAPAIRHALGKVDAITTVSEFLRRDTARLVDIDHPIQVIPNFFTPRRPHRNRRAVRAELGLCDREAMILHMSNLRPVKRIDLLLEATARIRPRESFRLVVIAGGDFAPFREQVRRLGLDDRVVVRENVSLIEDYVAAADLSLITSESESFCLSILEAMTFGCPTVATAVGGIPEVIEHGKSGLLVPFGDAEGLAREVETLIASPRLRSTLGRAAQTRARDLFTADRVVPAYVDLYHRVRAHRDAIAAHPTLPQI